MELNQASIDLIKSFEGWRANAYKDAVGVWTIGYGHTSAAGAPKVTAGMKISLAEGEEMLRRDLKKYADAISSQVKVPLNPNQYGALVSWCYNVGPGNTGKSTLIKKLNKGDYKAVPSELAKWNKAGGKVLAGLTRRRKAEGDLFQTPYAATSAPKPVPTPIPPKQPEPAPAALPESSQGIWADLIEAFHKLAAALRSK
jgi:lysozyme